MGSPEMYRNLRTWRRKLIASIRKVVVSTAAMASSSEFFQMKSWIAKFFKNLGTHPQTFRLWCSAVVCIDTLLNPTAEFFVDVGHRHQAVMTNDLSISKCVYV